MNDFIKGLQFELNKIISSGNLPLFIKAYNNTPDLRRHKNRKPRTDLMLKGLHGKLGYEYHGLISHVAYNVLRIKNDFPFKDFGHFTKYISYERFFDIGISYGSWWDGTLYLKLLVEIENNIKEFKGTLSDLLSRQAKLKWAVFYHENPEQIKNDLHQLVADVFTSFYNNFTEDNLTRYEILILPEKLKENEFNNVRILEISFFSKEWKSLPEPRIVNIKTK